MIVANGWQKGVILHKKEGNPKLESDLAALPLPGRTSGQTAPVFLGGSDLGIAAKSKNPDLALDLVKLLAGTKFQTQMATVGGVTPNATTLLDLHADDPYLSVFDATAKNSRFTPTSPNWANVEAANILPDMLVSIFTGRASIADATKQASTRMTDTLNAGSQGRSRRGEAHRTARPVRGERAPPQIWVMLNQRPSREYFLLGIWSYSESFGVDDGHGPDRGRLPRRRAPGPGRPLGGVPDVRRRGREPLHRPQPRRRPGAGRRPPTPAGCPNNPRVRAFVRAWADAAIDSGADTVFWDEPHWVHLEHFGLDPSRWGCRCRHCQAPWADRHGGRPMPTELTDEVLAFRQDCLVDFVADLVSHCQRQGAATTVCLLPLVDGVHGLADWSAVAALAGLGTLATDPYWRPSASRPATARW